MRLSRILINKKIADNLSPIRILFLVIISIIVTETLIMALIRSFHSLPVWAEFLIDSILLSVILLPVMYLFTYRPLTLMLEDRKKKEEALKKSKERYKSVTQTAPDAIVSADKNGFIIGWNYGAEKMFGYKAAEITGKELSIIIPDEYHDSHLTGFNRLNTGGEKHIIGHIVELSGLHKAGHKFPVELTLSEWETTEGRFYTGIIRDITIRKRAELESTIISEISNGLATTSNLGELIKLIHNLLKKVVYADNFFIALHNDETGLFSFPYFVDKFDEAPLPMSMGRSCTSYVFRTVKPLLLTRQIFLQLKERNEVELIGSPSPSWIGIPLQTSSKVIGVLVLQHYEDANVYSERDVQFLGSVGSQIALAISRKQAEEELIESEIRLKVILQSTADGILAVDNNGKVIRTNRRFAELWRIPSELLDSHDDKTLINFILEQLVYPDEFISKVQKLYNSIEEDLDHLYFRDGRTFERFSAPLLMDESLIGRVWSFRDITDARRAEEEIRKRNEELTESNAEKDKFFSIIAHDLRGPMSNFVALTELLSEDNQNIGQEATLRLIKSMKVSSENLYRLLENLLEWSLLKRGVIDYKPGRLNLKKVVNFGIEVTSVSSLKKGVTIDICIPDDLEVLADEHMFESVVRNLITNAIKFTPRGGKIKISAHLNKDNLIEIKVNDTGIGMTPELKSRLFQLNENTGRKGTDGEPSTGLGLLLCKEFIEKHRGKIWVESEEGTGSTFYFTLPYYLS